MEDEVKKHILHDTLYLKYMKGYKWNTVTKLINNKYKAENFSIDGLKSRIKRFRKKFNLSSHFLIIEYIKGWDCQVEEIGFYLEYSADYKNNNNDFRNSNYTHSPDAYDKEKEFDEKMDIHVHDPEWETIMRGELESESVEELAKRIVKLEKRNRKLHVDVLVKNKDKRYQHDLVNSNESFLNRIAEYLPTLKMFKPPKYKNVKYDVSDKKGSIVISDVHFNETVRLEDTNGLNEYNFNIAGRRLKKLINEAIFYFKSHNINHIHLVFLGDLFNSPRRKDEIIRNQFATAEAVLVANSIGVQIINDLYKEFNKIEVHSVCGNESRLDEHVNSVNFHDNWDFIFHYLLNTQFLNANPDIIFHPMAREHHKVVNLGSDKKPINILLYHGHNAKGGPKNLEVVLKKYQQMFRKKGIVINEIWAGHFHHTNNIEGVKIGGCTVGANAYSTSIMGLNNDAEHNIHIIQNVNKQIEYPIITTIPINVQHVNFNGCPTYFVPQHADHAVQSLSDIHAETYTIPVTRGRSPLK